MRRENPVRFMNKSILFLIIYGHCNDTLKLSVISAYNLTFMVALTVNCTQIMVA